MEKVCITLNQGIINKPISINVDKIHVYCARNLDSWTEVRNYSLKYVVYVLMCVCVCVCICVCVCVCVY